jgi:type I restriction-modification system DNA methylase subunit
MRFEAIVANPPFRLIGLPVLCLWTTTVSLLMETRSSSKADFAFVQHGTPAGR